MLYDVKISPIPTKVKFKVTRQQADFISLFKITSLFLSSYFSSLAGGKSHSDFSQTAEMPAALKLLSNL